jgi:hypothetical protein
MDGSSGFTPGSLIEELGLYAGPAVWGYRDAVTGEAEDLGVTSDHDLGLVQIGLHLANCPNWIIGWRLDHGWYLVRQPRIGEPPQTGPAFHRTAHDLADQLMPTPAAVAHWLRDLSNHRLADVGRAPAITAISAQQRDTVLARLRAYLPREQHPAYSWSDDRPLPRHHQRAT